MVFSRGLINRCVTIGFVLALFTSMKRKEIVNYIAEKHELTQQEAKAYINKAVALMTEKLKSDTAFTIPGLGTFEPYIRKGRKYFMPWKKQTYFVPKKRIVQFHASSTIEEDLKYNKMGRSK